MTIEQAIENAKRIHFIGIGGSGMCPLAEILHAEGRFLTGSDNNESDTLKRIRALGIPVTMGQKAENVDGADMVVFTAALLPDNPELVAAREKGIPTFERSKLFGYITRRYANCIGVCGTHGKTTTTSMLTQVLLENGFDPSAVIGGKLPLTGTNGIVGHSDTLVVEACEYKDTFLDLAPDAAVILNIDRDHMEYFKTLENLQKSFRTFAELATKCVIYNGSDANTVAAMQGLSGKEIITFGDDTTCDYSHGPVTWVGGAYPSFDVLYHGETLGTVTLGVPGEHNVLNALAVIATACWRGATFEQCAAAIGNFRGAGRRFEFLGEYNGAKIADDYAHHPKELEVTLNAAKRMGYKRVWAVFQPFTFSRTKMLLDDFAKALSIADRVVMTEIMGSREVNTYHVHTQDLADEIPGSVWFDTFPKVADYLKANIGEGDLVITLGCGDVYKIAHLILRGEE
ncbi:MAG: UDP-N-acetylmuramate--L-alanine ligase [Clostridia bacterium]|nr:UDP-N-acetylmuramate--L-alanine ligase [Clostridia bacterium]